MDALVRLSTSGWLPFAVVSGFGGNPRSCAGGVCLRMEGRFCESLDFYTLRKTLKRINQDVA
jgi:hypothetical protein